MNSENYQQVITRNHTLFDGVEKGLVLDCMDAGILDVLPESFDGFTTSQSVYQNTPDTSRLQLGVVPDIPSQLDAALLLMPKTKDELSFRLAWLSAQVRPGGKVYLLGGKKEGVQSGAKLLHTRLKGNGKPIKVDSARHCQLWETEIAENGPPFMLEDWERRVTVETPLGKISVCFLPGVFNAGTLDEGTRALLAQLDRLFDQLQKQNKQPEGRYLDFGCGAGIIGAAIKKKLPGSEVTFADNSALAVHCTRKTLAWNDLEGDVCLSDGLSHVTGTYKWIVSNPPFHTGIQTDYSVAERFLGEAHRYLKRNGRLVIVANSFLRYPEILKQQFGQFQVLDADSKFTVYLSQRAG